ncbi:uncharacterized protein [Chelonus insularis]|uniref:uncharacterized protein n=1 Tax=Chelonus insularis TaxID=460826 RepID=UPI00158E8A8E|nr:uncharacterized protein LOC118070501 [Chelonus insularis]XP_034945949.1 uncharacterized protein LOC118071102 [Chelonus insularis]
MPNKLENKVYDRHSYIFCKETEHFIKVRCKYYQTHSCEGAGIIENNIFTLTANHNHSAESTLAKENDLKNKLKEAYRNQLRSTYEIYDNIITTQEDKFSVP